MSNFTPEQLRAMQKKLPQDNQEAYFGEETADAIRQVALDNKITAGKIGILADETGLLMLGFTHPGEFIPHLAERLQIDKESAARIGQDVNVKVFQKIRDSLKQIHGGGTKETPAATPPSGGPADTEDITIPRIIKPMPPTKYKITNGLNGTGEAEKEKDIFAERTKDEIFRSQPETVEKTPVPKKEMPPQPQYEGGLDPYREPAE